MPTLALRQASVKVVHGVEAEPPPAPSDDYQYIQEKAFQPFWNEKSHWKQPWRSYLDTMPAVKALRGLGINFNQPAAQSDNAAHLATATGFHRARIEFSWNGFTYDDPTVMVAGSKSTLEAKIAACKAHGLRPLILLNSNSGSPCPFKNYPLTLTAEGKVRRSVAVDATSGKFKLTFSGKTTADLNYNASPAEVQAALEALPTVGLGNVEVEGGSGNSGGTAPYLVNFVKALFGTTLALTATDVSLSGGGDKVTITTVGDTQIHVEPSQVAGIVLGRTGITGGSIMGFYLFKAKSEDGTITLSQPLKVPLAAGKVSNCNLMRYAPWPAAVLADKVTPNPDFEENMLAWLAYAGRTCRKVKELYGSDDFDVEVWNEVSFGTQWLNINNYYEPDVTTVGRQAQAIYTRTVAYLTDPANEVPNVKVGNGFVNQNNSNIVAPKGDAIDRHPYPPIVTFPERDEAFELTIGNLDGQGKNQGPIKNVSWIPSYLARMPEYFLTQIQTESRIFDIAPFGSFLNNSHTGVGGGMGRAPLKSSAYLPHDTSGGLEPSGYLEPSPDQGPSREVWFTELGMFVPASAPGFSAADWRHIQAKILTRQFLAYMNKGVDAIHFYCMFGTGQYQMVEQAFFSAGAYPGEEVAGETMMAFKRISAAMAGAEDLAKPGAITLEGLSGGEENISGGFAGNPADLVKYPDLTNKDLFAFLPFQVNDTRRFVCAAYVMSRDVYKNHGGTGITRFDQPTENYTMMLGGFKGTGATITAEDPLKGTTVPLTVTGRTGTGATVKAPISDYPLILTIQEA